MINREDFDLDEVIEDDKEEEDDEDEEEDEDIGIGGEGENDGNDCCFFAFLFSLLARSLFLNPFRTMVND